jgi:hypothetical protein
MFYQELFICYGSHNKIHEENITHYMDHKMSKNLETY